MKKEEEATFLNLAKEDRIAKRNRNANARLAVTSTHNDPVGSEGLLVAIRKDTYLEKWPIDFHKHASLRIITAVIHTRKRDVLIIHNCYAPNKKKSSKEFFEELSYLQAILMHLL